MRDRWIRFVLRLLNKAGLLSFAFHIKQVESTRDREAFERLWSTTWLAQSYGTKDTISEIRRHYALYHLVSVDLLCTFLWCIPVGTMRIMLDSRELPALTDFQIEKHPEGNVAEITLLTIHPLFQGFGHRVAYLLFREMYELTRDRGMDGIVVAADRRLWVLLRRFLGFAFSQIGQEQDYEGSLTIPGYLDFTQQEEIILQHAPRNLLEQYVWRRFRS